VVVFEIVVDDQALEVVAKKIVVEDVVDLMMVVVEDVDQEEK
jgi:hypothetical protein